MTTERELLEQRRDQALADLVDLERQVAAGEVPAAVAERLRRRYEADAARAMDRLDTAPQPVNDGKGPAPSRRSRGRVAAYIAAAAIAVFAAAIVLPQYVAQRPERGFITGNEAAQSDPASDSRAPSTPRSTGRDLSKVTEAEMEAVIAANPDIVGMRLALARRYLDKGQYDKAGEHYGVALKQDPRNPDVLAQSGWLLFKLGKPDAALRFVDEALEIDPTSPEALWYKANILLDGRKNPDAALVILRQLSARDDLPADLHADVERLSTVAQQRRNEGTG